MLAIIVILSLVTGGLSLLCPNKFDPQQTVHLAHPTSCSKFLTCVGDHPFEQRCPEGLHWNVERSYCEYPQLSECSRGELEYFDTIDFDPKVVANSVCLPQFNQCPVNSNPSEQVIFMKHRDCQKFYACVATQQVELSCPPNLYWNSSSCRCDYEIDAEYDGTERVDEEIPQETDGEQNGPEESVDEDDEAADEEAAAEDAVADEPAADEAVGEVAGESQDGVVSEAEPEEVQENEETADDEVVDAEAEPQNEEDQEPTQEVDQSVDIVPNVRARRAADDEGTTTTAAATTTESATSVTDATSITAATTTTSSATTGSSGGGSSGSTSGPGSGGSVESGADVRTVSSIVMIVFTALMSVL